MPARFQALADERGRADGHGGFALLDLMLALIVLALIAVVALPGLRRPAGPLALRTAAYDLSAMLRNLRTTAIGAGRRIDARIEVGDAGMRVTGADRAVTLPPGTSVARLGRPMAVMSFSPDGTSSGGTFLLRRDAARLTVAVNADTGAIDIAGP